MCLGIPGKVISKSGEGPLDIIGKIEFSGIVKEVSLAYVPEVEVGEYVIVHAGFALNVLDEEEANQVFAYLKEINDYADEEEAELKAKMKSS